VRLLKGLFWGSVVALGWTHAGYPLAAAALARVRRAEIRKADLEPEVTVVVAAHDEEAVIGRRLANLLALDYPADRLEVVVASDASADRTDEIVAGFAAGDPRVRLVRCPRAGKVAALNVAVRGASSEIVAFSDANTTWASDALRRLVRSFADPEVGYVCGRVELERTARSARFGVGSTSRAGSGTTSASPT
jgi:cellulose synthase/poly-beta-1,6-N-acetylglucosamine synthase-like glycosyltransferase